MAPNPTSGFDTGTGTAQISIGGSPADANVAASSTHVCVTARAAFACYTKQGTPVTLGPGFSARPYTAKEFFEKSGISTITSVSGDTNYTKDARVIFSRFWKRFFLVVQAREATARQLIAVSKSENPEDGWWTYADVVGTASEPAFDWQTIGINSSHLLVSSWMVSAWSGGSGTGTRHLMYTASDLVAGKPYTRSEWRHVNANSAAPCIHESDTTDAFWVHRDDDTHATVWAVRNGNVTNKQVTIQSSSPAVNGTALGGTIVSYTNIGRAPQSAEFRNGKIVFVSNDGHTWEGQSKPNNAVRLVRLDVSKYFASSPSITVEIDRIYGRASSGDPAGAIFDYGWPAVATNSNGDIVVGSIRSNPTIYPELRASVWFVGQPDISSSVLLASSSSPLSQFHMAGAGSDRSSGGVYLAQQYGATTPSWRIHIAQMLGAQTNWRWCNKCMGLAFAGNGPPRKCPMGGNHDHTGSGNYALRFANTGHPGQTNWRWCNKCMGLAFAGNGPPRKCPMGGNHDHTGSGNYELVQYAANDVKGTQIQDNWRWCNKCMGLAFAGNGPPRKCPMGGNHDHTGSGNYGIELIPSA